MLQKIYTSVLILGVALAGAGCGEFPKTMRSPDAATRYKLATTYFEKKDYKKAEKLFETVLSNYSNTGQAERVDYMYAYSVYQNKDYKTAAYLFENFIKKFPKSSTMEEIMFMMAYCNYLASDISELDQESTNIAMDAFQMFMEKFQDSPRIAEADKYVREMRAKLEKKAFDVAMLYYRLEDYDAAIISFRNCIQDYPDTKYKEEIMFKILQAGEVYAQNSVFEKKRERYTDAQSAAKMFMINFPDSKHAQEAHKISERIEIAMAGLHEIEQRLLEAQKQKKSQQY